LLRDEQQRPGSQVGELIQNYIKEGKIVPMEITIGLLEKAMIEHDSNRFLIDGFPRKLDQALAFEKEVSSSLFLKKNKRKLNFGLMYFFFKKKKFDG
jgi:UMP-CMP kinase